MESKDANNGIGKVHHENKCLCLDGDEKFWSMIAPFEPWSNKGKLLIIQYTVVMKGDPICSSMTLKLGPTLPNWKKFGKQSPWHIRFGPNYCGPHDQGTEMRFSLPNMTGGGREFGPGAKPKKKASFFNWMRDPVRYRLLVYPDNTVELKIMGERKWFGSLERDWQGVPQEFMDDETDTKPEYWIDNQDIEDLDSKKPNDWIDNERIPDDIPKPRRWDEAEDGPWAPTKPNPAYKGKWKPKLKANPQWNGFWSPRKIPNPAYQKDPEYYRFDDIAYIGFENWCTRGTNLIDDIGVYDSEQDADDALAHWKDWDTQTKMAYEKQRKNIPLVQTAWDDNTEVEDYDEDQDEGIPIMPNKRTRPEL
jgi:calreticulin